MKGGCLHVMDMIGLKNSNLFADAVTLNVIAADK
jgi:hypothetical protein